MDYQVTHARIADAPQIHRMVNSFAERGQMLARPLSEIYENIRDFFVVRQGAQVLGCAALHVSWADLGEVKSLAVDETCRHQHLAAQLVSACLTEATALGISNVFCLTYVPAFFQKCGFTEVEKTSLPHKIWGECYRCPKYPDCDETAMMLKMGESA